MKVVFTFVILTFVLSSILFLGGVTSNNQYSAIGYIVNLTQGNLSSSTLWIGLLAIISIITIAATANALTGGSSGVAITLGMAAMATWALSLVGDFIATIKAVGVKCTAGYVNGAFIGGGFCSIGYWIVWLFGILIVVGFVWALFDLVGGND